jgi:membrane protein implicated in regulation of membrane protease activity
VTEEGLLVAGLWTAFHHPLVFLVLLLLFVLLSVALAVFFVRAIRRMLGARKNPAT